MSRHLFYAPGKIAARRAAGLSSLAIGDQLFTCTVKLIAERGKARMAEGLDLPITPAAIDYFERKKTALRAGYFRQRYGRDYWTGQRRHVRVRDRHWNEGYQDGVDGSVFVGKPPAWSDARWRSYSLGLERANAEAPHA